MLKHVRAIIGKTFPFNVVAICLTLLFAGCVKNEFKLTFSLPQDVSANYRIVYYASDKRGGFTVENVAVIENGKGAITSPTRLPALVYLLAGHSSPIVIYVERDDEIKVSGSDRNPFTWTVGGNEINKSLSKWRNENAQTLATGSPDEVNQAIARYVLANPDSEISPLLLLTSFSRIDDETLFRRLWQSLGTRAATSQWVQMVARADIADGYVRTPGKLKSMSLRSLHHGVDTIRPEKAKATLLYFWYNGENNREETIDSLRSLSRQYPDSASRIIADICLEPDSVSWRVQLRRDSLSDVVRLWAPAGPADEKLQTLAVNRAPYFIVFSPDGNQCYRGSDLSDALSSFRKLYPPTPKP